MRACGCGGGGGGGAGKQVVGDAERVLRVARCIYRVPTPEIECRHAAAILNALAHATIRDTKLALHLAALIAARVAVCCSVL